VTDRSRHTQAVVDRIIVVLPDDASDDDRRAAADLGADVVVTRAELPELVAEQRQIRGQNATSSDVGAVLGSLTPAETRVLTELAHRPDTRSRLAGRLGVTASTLDNHLAAIKRKLLDYLVTSGNTPLDGYLSMEALIGWASRHIPDKKT
jgi:predicted DNA binding protein